MLGINGGEFLLLIVVALVVVGPERLPRYAEQLGAWVRTARSFALTAKGRVAEELGDDVADVDWAALDPRRYDPRRIVREALLDDSPPARPATPGAASSADRPRPSRRPTRPDTAAAHPGPPAADATTTPDTTGVPVPPPVAPFDDEAT